MSNMSAEEYQEKNNMSEEEYEDDITLASAKEIEKLRTDNEVLVTSWENTMQDNERLGKTIEQLRKVVKYYSDLEELRKHLCSLTRGKKNKTLSPTTINQYLMMLHKCFETSRKHGKYSLDGTKTIPEFPYMDTDSDDSRRCFYYDIADDGKVIANEEADLYKICDSWGSKYTELKYLVQIGIHTGMRLDEIYQLRVEDVKKDGNYDIIQIQQSERTKTKNFQSERIISIHQTLKKLGFIDFCNQISKEEHERVFQELN